MGIPAAGVELGGAKGGGFRAAARQRAVEPLHQVRGRAIADVPLADDDGRRAGVEERARQPDDAVAGQPSEPRRASAEHHELRVQIHVEDLVHAQVAVLARAGRQQER